MRSSHHVVHRAGSSLIGKGEGTSNPGQRERGVDDVPQLRVQVKISKILES